jgi:hypothetical protein
MNLWSAPYDKEESNARKTQKDSKVAAVTYQVIVHKGTLMYPTTRDHTPTLQLASTMCISNTVHPPPPWMKVGPWWHTTGRSTLLFATLM